MVNLQRYAVLHTLFWSSYHVTQTLVAPLAVLCYFSPLLGEQHLQPQAEPVVLPVH